MAERSSELDDLNDFGNTDRAADANAAERVAEEVGIVGESAAAPAYSSATLSDAADDDATRLATRDTDTYVTTTAGATDTTIDYDDDDDDAALTTTGASGATAATATNVSPPDAIVDASAEPEEIKASIENTRSEMTETINRIQEKLSISNITAQVKEEVTGQISGAYETVKHALFGATVGKAGGFFEKMSKSTNEFLEDYGPTISQAGTTVVRSAKTNPIPYALIGLGVTMLLLGNNKRKSRKVKSYRYVSDRNRSEDLDFDTYRRGGSTGRYATHSTNSGTTARSYTGGTSSTSGGNQDSTVSKAYNRVGGAASSAYQGVSSVAGSAASSVSGAASSAASTVSSAASSAASTVSSAASSALSGVSSAAGSVGSGTKRAASYAVDQIEENPIAVSGIAFALGAVVGLALPATETENQLLGEYRENLVQKAQEAAGGVIDKVQQVAGEVTRTVQEEAKAQGLTQQ